MLKQIIMTKDMASGSGIQLEVTDMLRISQGVFRRWDNTQAASKKFNFMCDFHVLPSHEGRKSFMH